MISRLNNLSINQQNILVVLNLLGSLSHDLISKTAYYTACRPNLSLKFLYYVNMQNSSSTYQCAFYGIETTQNEAKVHARCT